MRHAFYSQTSAGTDRQASRPFSFLETLLMESEGEDGKVRTERVVWTWRVHEIALHEASQREGRPEVAGRSAFVLSPESRCGRSSVEQRVFAEFSRRKTGARLRKTKLSAVSINQRQASTLLNDAEILSRIPASFLRTI